MTIFLDGVLALGQGVPQLRANTVREQINSYNITNVVYTNFRPIIEIIMTFMV